MQKALFVSAIGNSNNGKRNGNGHKNSNGNGDENRNSSGDDMSIQIANQVTEKQVEQYLVKKVRDLGGIAYKFTSPGRRHVPDRLVLFPGGRILFVECKRPGAKATKGQAYELHRISNLGFEALVIDSKEKIDDLIDELIAGVAEEFDLENCHTHDHAHACRHDVGQSDG